MTDHLTARIHLLCLHLLVSLHELTDILQLSTQKGEGNGKVKFRDLRTVGVKFVTMFLKCATLVCALLIGSVAASEDLGFTYTNGFRSANLNLDGVAKVLPNGLLALTNDSKEKGHAFYPHPVTFKKSSNSTSVFSFSTTFVCSIIPKYPKIYGASGIVFVIAPKTTFAGAFGRQYLGLFNDSNNMNASNHVVGIELDTIQNEEFSDINDNHVGIDVNGLNSVASKPVGYYDQNNGKFNNFSLISGKAMQVWVEYDGQEKLMKVTIAPINVPKPTTPLLSLSYDFSRIINQRMYVGFSSSTGTLETYHYVLGWSFKMNGQAEKLDLSQLPKLPRIDRPKKTSKFLTIGLPLISTVLLFTVIAAVVLYIRRKRKFEEVLEDWERDYGPHRFKYKDLYVATKGFRDRELLGKGGFGRVYRGTLPTSKIEIAVKKVSHQSRQGMKEFIAEIVSIGRLRHRNIAPLLGYCRRKGELLLVYDYMPNGSLDKFLYDKPEVTLNWHQRFRVIKGVASGLLYLHEEWEKVVIHRDIKSSNVLLDGELNGRLGDFGLARLYDHGTDPQTTHVVGTLGYLAPEHTRTGKATTSTDVYAFGAFLLEAVCGKRPIEQQESTEDLILVDWVFSLWSKGEILGAVDPNLGGDYVAEEAELVLKLGLLCSQSEPMGRPTMRQIVQYLEGDIPLPELAVLGTSASGLMFAHNEGVDDFVISHPSSIGNASTQPSFVAEPLIYGAR